jgi:hypothetical protein
MRQRRVIVICVLLLAGVVTCIAPFLFFRLQIFFAEQALERQLLVLDAGFATTRALPPIDATDNTLFPLQVGDFLRLDITSNTRCRDSYSQCPSATYLALNGQRVYVTAQRSSGQTAATLSMVRYDPCGAEIGSKTTLRSEAKHAYIYQTCFTFLVDAPTLSSITWSSGVWLIRLDGGVNTWVDFLAQYPF